MSPRKISLACGLLNAAFAINCFIQGDVIIGILCTGFATICLYNSSERYVS